MKTLTICCAVATATPLLLGCPQRIANAPADDDPASGAVFEDFVTESDPEEGEMVGQGLKPSSPAKGDAGLEEAGRAGSTTELQEQERAEQARNQTMTTLRQAFAEQDWDAALAAMEPLIAEFPEDAGIKQLKMTVLQRAGRAEEVKQLQAELVESQWENPVLLDQIAWSIATANEPRDLDLALRAAEQANKLTDESNGAILDTLARVYYESGDLEEAIIWQKNAVEAEPESAELQAALDRYEAEKSSPDAEGGPREEKPEIEPENSDQRSEPEA